MAAKEEQNDPLAPAANGPVEIQQLLKLSPDLVKVLLEYARPKAHCKIVDKARYHIMRGKIIQYAFFIPPVITKSLNRKYVIDAIDRFLDPNNSDSTVMFECDAIVDISSFEVVRLGQVMRIERRNNDDVITIYLETDIYYDAVCTMLRDIQQRLKTKNTKT